MKFPCDPVVLAERYNSERSYICWLSSFCIPHHNLIPVCEPVSKMDDVLALLIRSSNVVWIQMKVEGKQVGLVPGIFLILTAHGCAEEMGRLSLLILVNRENLPKQKLWRIKGNPLHNSRT